jgi:V/A-type H+-transporting ATPase subunit K
MKVSMKSFGKITGASLVGTLLVAVIFFMLTASPVFGQEPEAGVVMTAEMAKVKQWGFIAAAIAFGLGAIAAGIAIASVGAAAMGAMSEKPEIGGQALIFIALAEGLVVFGFIIALMILLRV